MTDLPTIARDNALSCEAKKHGYRQTQDGVVVSFVLHPHEIPDALAVAPLGTRYMIALVELSDDETPKQNPRAGATPTLAPSTKSSPRQDSAAQGPNSEFDSRDGGHTSQINAGEGPVPSTHAAELLSSPSASRRGEPAPNKWNTMSSAKQAGILCAKESFIRFLGSAYDLKVVDEEGAAAMVRHMCGVKSRADIDGIPAARKCWTEIVSEYNAWMHEPAVIGQ